LKLVSSNNSSGISRAIRCPSAISAASPLLPPHKNVTLADIAERAAVQFSGKYAIYAQFAAITAMIEKTKTARHHAV
jgi:hypothetical protein